MEIDANEVRRRLCIMSGVDTGGWEITPGQRGACVGTLNKYLGGNDMRRLVLGWLFAERFAPLSSKELTPGQWYAIYNWIGWSKTDDGEELLGELFIKEHAAVLSAALLYLSECDQETQHKFGISAFDMVVQGVALGGKLTHTFDERQEVQYDFSASRKMSEREKQIMEELGYDDPGDVLSSF